MKNFAAGGKKRALVGFEAFRTDTNSDFSSAVYSGAQESFVLPFRALLNKRDATTRTKAITDLEQAYLSTDDLQAVRDTLPHFAYLYTRILQRDNDRRIRSGAAKIIKILAEKVPKAMANRFDTFGPDWLLACFDLDRESSTLALQALKLVDTRDLYSEMVHTQLCKFARQRNPDENLVGHNDDESAEDLLERSCRVRMQALSALGFLLEKTRVEIPEESNWFKFLLATEEEGGTGVRMACYRILQLATSAMLTPAAWKFALRIVQERDNRAVPSMFACLVKLGSHEEFWRQPDTLKKAFFPEFFRLLRRSSNVILPQQHGLVEFLAQVPDVVYACFTDGKQGFCQELFSALLESGTGSSSSSRYTLNCLEFYIRSKDVDLTAWEQPALDAWLNQDGGDSSSFQALLANKEFTQRVQVKERIASCVNKEQIYIKLCNSCTPDLFREYVLESCEQELLLHESPKLLVAAKPFLQNFTKFLNTKSIDFAAALCACDAEHCFDALLPKFDLAQFLAKTQHVQYKSHLMFTLLPAVDDDSTALDERLVAPHLVDEDSAVRALQFQVMGEREFVERFTFSRQVYNALVCYSFRDSLLFKVLDAYFSNSELKLNEVEEFQLTTWLERAPASAVGKWWSKLCAVSSPLAFAQRPALELILAYLECGQHSTALLQAKLQIESMEDLFYWVFAARNGRVSPQNRDQRRLLQETTELDWFPDFLHLCKDNTSAAAVEHVLAEFIPDAWLGDSITNLCISKDNQHVLPVLLRRRREMQITQGDDLIADMLASNVFTALELCTSSSSSGSKEEHATAEQQEQEAQSSELNVGDVVMYSPAALQGRKVSCTVVSKHSDLANGYYYTVRYWSSEDNYSREVQTERARLEVGGDAEELERESKHAQLQVIQKQLQQARTAGNREEIVRLMRLVGELEIKPQDSEQVKREAAEKRRERERAFLKASQQNGGSESPALDGDSSGNVQLIEFTPEIESGLAIIQSMAWRFDEEQPEFPLTEVENAALEQITRKTCNRLEIKTPRQVSLLSAAPYRLHERAMVQLAQHACEFRNVDFLRMYQHRVAEQDKKETINNRLLTAYVANDHDEFAEVCEPLLAQLRFSPHVVLDFFPQLFRMVLERQSMAAFAVLFRFPNQSEPLLPNSLLATKFEAQDEDGFTMLLIWLLVLRRIQVAKSQPGVSLEAIHAWLKTNDLLFHVLDQISSSLCMDGVEENVHVVDWFAMDRDKVCSHAFFQTTRTLPTLVREWWCDHVVGRLDRDLVMRYMAQSVTPGLIRGDLKELAQASSMFDPNEFQLRLSSLSKQVTVVSLKDDCVLEMQITFPDAYPLFPATVECVKNIGVKPEKWKRWALQIVQLLNKRNGSLLDAIQIWKRNLDKEFEGVEPCPICYSVLHASDSSLPKLTCRTCKNTFHGLCLSTWFTTSHQSLCPLCKQSFLAGRE